ncbi:CheR family methyltransferase [Sorangium sp. So ce542]|uniref:CheR family methyltransferase n=1 Tax=Sorangium sp. So ce542 TaxID=3133316 RepID=UPI003F5ED793
MTEGLESGDEADVDAEIRLLVETIHRKYRHDFRGYSLASMRRRVKRAAAELGCGTLSQVRHRVLCDRRAFSTVLQSLTVPFSEMFRDPAYFLSIRERVAPRLAALPAIKIWIPGCSTGEELYSMAILLAEEGLLERTVLYATDVNPEALRAAERGVYALDRVQAFSASYHRAGGRRSLSDYYAAAYGGMMFDRSLRARAVFADHSLATDGVFAEVHLVSCRNVLIYFDRALKDRAVGLFRDSLAPQGFLGIGMRETLHFCESAGAFDDFVPEHRIYRRC